MAPVRFTVFVVFFSTTLVLPFIFPGPAAAEWVHPTGLSDYMSLTGTDTRVYKSEYRNGSWTHPSGLSDNISPNTESVEYPHVAVDSYGNTIIVWEQYDGVTYRIYKSEYTGTPKVVTAGSAQTYTEDDDPLTLDSQIIVTTNLRTLTRDHSKLK